MDSIQYHFNPPPPPQQNPYAWLSQVFECLITTQHEWRKGCCGQQVFLTTATLCVCGRERGGEGEGERGRERGGLR